MIGNFFIALHGIGIAITSAAFIFTGDPINLANALFNMWAWVWWVAATSGKGHD